MSPAAAWQCRRGLDQDGAVRGVSPSVCAQRIYAAQAMPGGYRQDCADCAGPQAAHHRLPPIPPCYYQIRPGFCRWCGQPTAGRSTWHPDCAAEFRLLTWPEDARRACLARDGHRCQACDRAGHEADHKIPLAEALPAADDPWWPWRLDNMQTLCTADHQAKTAEMAARWARWRRAWQAQQTGQGRLFTLET